jgi:uncharacterized membrane protein
MNDSSRGLRLSDAERQTAVDQLGEQFAVGRLTREEFDERSDAVWSAKTQGDLFPVFADLPAVAPRTASGPPRGARRGVGAGLPGVRRLLVPLFAVLLVLTVITHLPLVLIAVGAWFFVGHRRRHHHHGGWDRRWDGGAAG